MMKTEIPKSAWQAPTLLKIINSGESRNGTPGDFVDGFTESGAPIPTSVS
jgi:hypothetical protein